ncbi:MAG: hypothetical protein ACM3U1_09945 [Chloroflexota bacterium]
MKTLVKYLFIGFFAATATGMAQGDMPPASKPDQELTKKEAILRIQDFQTRVSSLESQLNDLNNRYSANQTTLNNLVAEMNRCRDDIKNLLGATDADIEAFRQRLGVIEGRIRELRALSDAALAERQEDVRTLEADLNALRSNKVSLMPEFYDRIIADARDIRGLYRERKTNTYTVGTWAEDRDCLWNIAGKIEIYGDPFLWPKIWQGNTDQIRNPDIIHPGQVLQIPAKGAMSDEETRAQRKYWRNKRARAAAAAAAAQQTPETTPGQ